MAAVLRAYPSMSTIEYFLRGSTSDFSNSILCIIISLFVVIIFQWRYVLNLKMKLKSERLSHLQEIKKWEDLREVERKGRISSQQKSCEKLLQDFNSKGFTFQSIGKIESPFPDRRGTPRQPLLVTAARGKIRFDRRLIQFHFFKEIQEFSHIWVLFIFHKNTNIDSIASNCDGKGSTGMVAAKVKPPRLHGIKVGCLSTRSPHRPCNIGLSLCQVESVGDDYIEISGIDMVHGTPILDIKPYIPCDSIPLDENILQSGGYGDCLRMSRKLKMPNWIISEDIKFRDVVFSETAESCIDMLVENGNLKFCSSSEQTKQLVAQVLRQDIRGVHQGRGKSDNNNQLYQLRLDNMNISFSTQENEILILAIESFQSTD